MRAADILWRAYMQCAPGTPAALIAVNAWLSQVNPDGMTHKSVWRWWFHRTLAQAVRRKDKKRVA